MSGRALWVALSVLTLAACSQPTQSADTTSPTDVTPAQAARVTCPEPETTHTQPALELADRELVPLSRSTYGVETTFGTDQRGFTLVSGGYLDDVLEAYDDLQKVGESVVRGVDADMLAGTFVRSNDTRAAIWREPDEPPCDAHALVAWNLTAKQFNRIVEGLR